MTKQKMTPSEGLVKFLNEIPDNDYLRPRAIYPQLLEAAAKVKTGGEAAVITALLGPGNSYGIDVPIKPLKFPEDHKLHLNMGTEWYWLICNLEVEGSGGLDKIGVLLDMTRMRAVSLKVQEEAGWSDEDAQIVDNVVTVTLATRKDNCIIRRSPNTQWGALGGKIKFDSDPFHYQVGKDYLKGSKDVLPLKIHVDDGENMRIDLTMRSDLPAEKAFFLQGAKKDQGVIPAPHLGIYYSFPQLDVKGTVIVGGTTYKVKGIGWLDHQLMMNDANAPQPPTPQPTPKYKPIIPSNGWSWCGFNFSNGDAFTAIAYQIGTIQTRMPVNYGIYLHRTPNGWARTDVMGSLAIDRFIPGLGHVLTPTTWVYQVTDPLSGLDLEMLPVPLYPDGTFQGGTLEIDGETAVTLNVIDRTPISGQFGNGKVFTGAGYCESVCYEPYEQYVERCLKYLGVG